MSGFGKSTGGTQVADLRANLKAMSAPAPIENRINTHPMIELSMVSGVGQQAAYAVVVLAEDLRPKVTDPNVREEVNSNLGALLAEVNNALADYEQLRMFVVAPEPWTIDNGCLTPTMKIKRARIEAARALRLIGGPLVKYSLCHAALDDPEQTVREAAFRAWMDLAGSAMRGGNTPL